MRSPTKSAHLRSAAMLLLANLIWAGQGVAVKLLSGGLGTLAVALLPFYAVTAIGFCFLISRPALRQRLTAAWHCRAEFLLIGIAGQFLAQVGMTLGVTWSYAATGSILSLLIPILSALLAPWLLQERLSLLRVACLFLGIGGVLVLSPLHAQTSASGLRPLAGNLMISAGCLGSAFYNVYSKRLLKRFSDLEILFFSYLATAMVSVPVLACYEPACLHQLASFRPAQWIAFGYLAVFVYGLSMVAFLRALHTVDVIVASASMYLVPIFGVVFAGCILGERLTPLAIAGSAIVLLATLLLLRFDNPAPPASESIATPALPQIPAGSLANR